MPIGSHIIHLEKVDSTNNFAKQLLSKSKPQEGTVILARHQFAGKGQIGNSWVSNPGENIALSAIVYPEFLPTEKLFYLNIVTSLALYDYVDSRTCKHTAIKWPNDILANRKKVAGILIENSFSGSNINYSILGIGLNLNQSQFPKFPVPATSLSLETNETFDLENEWPKLLEFLNERYQQLQSLQFEKMKIDYLERLFGYRELCRFNREEKPFIGVVEDVDDLGRLHIATPAKRLDFDFKEVTFILG